MARANPRRRELNDVVVKAIQSCGWNVLFYNSLDEQPFQIQIYDGAGKSFNLSIYLWTLTHGGGSRDPNEYRIQLHVPRFVTQSGYETLVLGWYKADKVFAGFDITKHDGLLGASSSIQVDLPALQDAAVNGLSAADKNNGEIAIAFRQDYFVTYVENLATLHSFGTAGTSLNALNSALNPQVDITPAILNSLPVTRQTVMRTINQKVRAAGFRDRVLTAYGHMCAFCGVQLELVDAAHIIPVAIQNSTDSTDNGIALCSLHHRAYDAALITFDPKFRVMVSDKRKQYLNNIARDGGLVDFEKFLRTTLIVPPTVTDRPTAANIQQANQLRGW
jgi:putative restriction endonuclease